MLYAVHARADVFTGAETVDVWIPLHCFDAVGLVIWPVKIVPEMTCYVLSGTLSLYTTTGARGMEMSGITVITHQFDQPVNTPFYLY